MVEKKETEKKAKGTVATKKPKAAPKVKAAKAEVTVASREGSSASVAHYALLRRPIVTEKASMISVDRNRVVFEVPKTATKTEIRAAVEAVYGVKVAKVRTVNIMGKIKRTGTSSGRRASSKKAYVIMKEGQTIDVVEGL